MKSYLSVARQVPEFARSEYPAFIEFLKAYYKWLEEEYSIGKIGNVLDLDNTVDGFLDYFRNQLDIHGITARTDDTTYLKNIKQLYTSKGSFAGIEFLFKILYNKSAIVSQPWDVVFKASEGKWSQDSSLLVIITKGSIQDLSGNPVIVTDSVGRTHKTFVRDINSRRTGVDELFVSRFTPQSRLTTFTTEDGSVTGNILNTTTRASVQRSGSGFRVGQVFPLDSATGAGSLIKVKSVNEQGGILAVDIISFGTGYATDFNITISPTNAVDAVSLGARINIGTFSYITDDNANMQNDRGQIIKHDYTLLDTAYMVDPTYVGESAGEIKSQPGAHYDNERYAIILARTGNLCVYPGYYLSGDNIIGDAVYIQDSNYYQAFSYVTSLEETLDKYSSLLRRVLHPAGTKHFGNYQVNNRFELDIAIDPQLNLISKADVLREFLQAVDQIIFDLSIELNDEFNATDSIITTSSYQRSFSTAVLSDHNVPVFDVSISVPEVTFVTVTDSIALTPGFDVLLQIDAVDQITSFQLDKYEQDNVQTANGIGGLYMEPYYVLPANPTPYWEAGYTENERAFTN